MKVSNIKIIFLIAFVLFVFKINAQNEGKWAWIAGSLTDNVPQFGILQIEDTLNTPYNWYEARNWVDLNGNLWIYAWGDTWKFVTASSIWIRMHGEMNMDANFGQLGVEHEDNVPPWSGLGQSASWTGNDGFLYYMVCREQRVSMWRYNTVTNRWCWIHGNFPLNHGTIGIPSPLNNPGYFGESPISWIDESGDLWFYSSYYLGEMWRYNIESNRWICMRHGNIPDYALFPNLPSNATQGPNRSYTFTHWKSFDEKFYLFGRTYSTSTSQRFSIMYSFDPKRNFWTVEKGNDFVSNYQSYFVDTCVFDNQNLPGYMTEQTACWEDQCGRLWGFFNVQGFLWCYDPVIKQFAITDNIASFEYFATQKGDFSPLNHPGSGIGGSSWVDNEGNFYRLGSHNNSGTQISAMWKYVINPDCPKSTLHATATSLSGCSPLEIELLSSYTSNSLIYSWEVYLDDEMVFESNELRPALILNEAGSYRVVLKVEGYSTCSGQTDDSTQFFVNVLQSPISAFEVTPSFGYSPLEVVMTNNSLYSTNFFWDFGNGNTDYSNSVNDSITSLYVSNGEFIVTLVSFNGICSDTSFYQVNVIGNETPDFTFLVLIPNFLTANNDNVNDYFGIFTNTSYQGHIQILNRWGNVVFENDFISEESIFTPLWDGRQSSEGVYFYKIMLFDEEFKEQFSGFFHLIR